MGKEYMIIVTAVVVMAALGVDAQIINQNKCTNPDGTCSPTVCKAHEDCAIILPKSSCCQSQLPKCLASPPPECLGFCRAGETGEFYNKTSPDGTTTCCKTDFDCVNLDPYTKCCVPENRPKAPKANPGDKGAYCQENSDRGCFLNIPCGENPSVCQKYNPEYECRICMPPCNCTDRAIG